MPYPRFDLRNMMDEAALSQPVTVPTSRALLDYTSPRVPPPVTQNAVAGPTVTGEEPTQPAYPTQYRTGYDAAATTAAAQAVRAPYPQGRVSGNESNAALPYGFVNTTNAARNATFAMPSFNGAGAPAQATVSGTSLPPEFHAQLASLLDEARPLLSSKGIVDRLRGRQLLGARTRLASSAAALSGARTGEINAAANVMGANTAAYRAGNEVPLAMLQAGVHKYATDVGADTAAMHDASYRYATDVGADTHKYATDAQVAVHLPTIQREDLVNQQITSGDLAGAEETSRLGKYPPLSRNPPAPVDMMQAGGAYVHDPKSNSFVFRRYDEINPAMKKK